VKKREMNPESSVGLKMKGHKMVVDEMEILGKCADVDPLPSEAYEQARAVLQAAIALDDSSGTIEAVRQPKWLRRPAIACSGVAAAAAAAALVFVAIPRHSPSDPAVSVHVASPLVRLADYVNSSPAPAGNAALVARTTTSSNGSSVTVYDLYADDGQYFFSQTEGGLAGQVNADNNLAAGLFAREVAAAKQAATGSVQIAAQNMADAANPSHVISPTQNVNSAAIGAKEAATGRLQAGSLYDNWVWEDSQDAIIAGAGEPQVRAGVLRILATLPDVTVKSGTSGGQPTLVLTAGPAELGDGYVEQLTINASTGIPMFFTGGEPGQTPAATVRYQVSRVTLSDIAAGKL
jgi:hypothetical protein